MPKSLPTIGWGAAFTFGVALAIQGCESKPLPEATKTAAEAGASGSPDEGAAGHDGSSAGAGGVSTAEPVTLTVLERAHITSDPEADTFQRARAAVDFGEAEVAKATLRVMLESPCFPFSGWSEQGVPEGQNWPERCDAFDRTLSVSLDDPDDADTGPPGIELLRAITPFGGPLELSADITDVVNGLPGEHQLRVRIDTWSDADGIVSGSKGEWIASASIELSPGAAPRRVLAVVPLVYETQTVVDADPVRFEVPEGTRDARLDYVVTGHGGAPDFTCTGPAEEFCRRLHQVRVDDALALEIEPWRGDCESLCTSTPNEATLGPATYCAENPCGDPRSVRAARANWCPGSATGPFPIWHPSLVQAGEHELSRRIVALKEGGGWQVSLTYFAFE